MMFTRCCSDDVYQMLLSIEDLDLDVAVIVFYSGFLVFHNGVQCDNMHCMASCTVDDCLKSLTQSALFCLLSL